MKSVLQLLVAVFFTSNTNAQNLYFPPISGNDWDTTSLSDLGWCSDQLPPLYDFLEAGNSKAFIVLKDGKIVIEKYFGTFTQDSLWYWASAGKTLTAFMVGKAQEDGYLSISDTTSAHLGTGWTSLTSAQEEKITVRNQLAMTSGLDDGSGNVDCTLPSCLTYLADPGTRWSYHNAPYTLLQEVVTAASSLNFNSYMNTALKTPTGMDGLFVPIGSYNRVYFSKPRSMARFGLLMLNNGNWNGTQVMNDLTYLNDMVTPSQTINNAYGYLWWLNGQSSFMLPQTQFVFSGQPLPSAPADVYSALGKNGQILNVSPSNNLVVVRMGNNPDNSFVPILYCDTMWQKLNAVMCGTVNINQSDKELDFMIYPNPATDLVTIKSTAPAKQIQIVNSVGQIVKTIVGSEQNTILSLQGLPRGVYFARVDLHEGQIVKKIILE
ncbi:MAG: serine hydrolase [Crocinitomicaceae bacterium]